MTVLSKSCVIACVSPSSKLTKTCFPRTDEKLVPVFRPTAPRSSVLLSATTLSFPHRIFSFSLCPTFISDELRHHLDLHNTENPPPSIGQPSKVSPILSIDMPPRNFFVPLLAFLFVLVPLISSTMWPLPRPSYFISFGSNDSGRLGHAGPGSVGVVDLPVIFPLCAVSDVSVTSNFTAVRTLCGEVFNWGDNSTGQLGLSVPTTAAGISQLELPGTPFQNGSTINLFVYGMTALEGTFFALTRNGIYSAGSDLAFQITPLTSANLSDSMTVTLTQFELWYRPILDTLSCSNTRCYFRQPYNLTWEYWGNAFFDPFPFTPYIQPLSEFGFPLRFWNIDWVSHGLDSVVIHSTPWWGNFTAINWGSPYIHAYTATNFSWVDITANMGCQMMDGTKVNQVNWNGQDARKSIWQLEWGLDFAAYVCNDGLRVYGFGNNTYGQLGTDPGVNSWFYADNNHSLVFDLSTIGAPGETIINLALSKWTVYIFTSYNNTYAIGYAGDYAFGDDVGFSNTSTPFLLNNVAAWKAVVNPSQNQVVQVWSSPLSHGLFATVAQKWGNCPALPAEMWMDHIFCDYEDILNFPTDFWMPSGAAANMKVYTRMRGDVYMTGNSTMASNGMEMIGDVQLLDTSHVDIHGDGSVLGDLLLEDNSSLAVNGSLLTVQGDIQTSSGSNVTIFNFTQFFDGPPLVNLTGDASFFGQLHLVLSPDEAQALIMELTPAMTTSPQTVPSQPSSPPSTVPGSLAYAGSTFSRSAPTSSPSSSTPSRSITVLSISNGTIADGSVLPVVSSPDPCIASQTVVSGNALNVLFSLAPSCVPAPFSGPITPTSNSDPQTIIIAASAAGGGLVLLVIVTIVLILVIKPCRAKVVPFRDATANRLNSPTRYNKAGQPVDSDDELPDSEDM